MLPFLAVRPGGLSFQVFHYSFSLYFASNDVVAPKMMEIQKPYCQQPAVRYLHHLYYMLHWVSTNLGLLNLSTAIWQANITLDPSLLINGVVVRLYLLSSGVRTCADIVRPLLHSAPVSTILYISHFPMASWPRAVAHEPCGILSLFLVML